MMRLKNNVFLDLEMTIKVVDKFAYILFIYVNMNILMVYVNIHVNT